MRTSDFYPESCWEDIRGLRLERVAQADFGFRKIAVTAVPRTGDRGAGDGDDRRSIEGRERRHTEKGRGRGQNSRGKEGDRPEPPFHFSALSSLSFCPGPSRDLDQLGRLGAGRVAPEEDHVETEIPAPGVEEGCGGFSESLHSHYACGRLHSLNRRQPSGVICFGPKNVCWDSHFQRKG